MVCPRFSYGGDIGLLTYHPVYLGLGSTFQGRQENYLKLFKKDLESELVNEIRMATNGNFALGNDRFQEEIATNLGRRVTRGKPGRPRKCKSDVHAQGPV